jgi:hypothetical protein
MNSAEMEKVLYNHGFSPKDIAALRQHVNKRHISYLVLLEELQKRFIGCCILILILVGFWIKVWITGSQEDIEAYSFAAFLGIVILYFLAPMKLAVKAFLFLKRNRHLL